MKKTVTLFLIVFSCLALSGQKLFVRVYDQDGKKIHKGRIIEATDSSLILASAPKSSIVIPVTSIGTIKTKHSAGHSFLIATLISAGTLAIIGATTADPNSDILSYSPGEGAATGALIGIIPGAIIGGVSSLVKNVKIFKIDQRLDKWKEFKNYLSEVYHYR